MSPLLWAAAALVVLKGCSGRGDFQDDSSALCSESKDLRQHAQPVIGGAAQSFLGEGLQTVQAVVQVENQATAMACTGIIVRARWVLTARHCVRDALAAQLVLHRPLSAGDSLHAVGLHPHESLDIALVTFNETLAGSVIELAPDVSRIGKVGDDAAAWGYGLDEAGQAGALLAARVAIASVTTYTIETFGGGVSGACLGDSGGPLVLRDVDGRAKVIGILSSGSASCRGKDTFVRLNADVLAWIVAKAGPERISPTATDCGQITHEGTCLNQIAVWCDDQRGLRGEVCQRCGWSLEQNRFDCLGPSEIDPCSSVTSLGECQEDGAMIATCQSGSLSVGPCSVGTRCSIWSSGGFPTCVGDVGRTPMASCLPDVAP